MKISCNNASVLLLHKLISSVILLHFRITQQNWIIILDNYSLANQTNNHMEIIFSYRTAIHVLRRNSHFAGDICLITHFSLFSYLLSQKCMEPLLTHKYILYIIILYYYILGDYPN